MEEKKYFLVSMEDEKAKVLADVLGSKTCKRIIDLLAETKEVSEKEIAQKLDAPINTIEYNLKKLLGAGIIEKAKNYFWSTKGRKIDLYNLSNKSIIISPKSISRVSSKLKSILPAVIISGLGAVLVRQFILFKSMTKEVVSEKGTEAIYSTVDKVAGAMSSVPNAAQEFTQSAGNTLISTSVSPAWLWFLSGAIFALFIFAILNWRKM